MLKISLLSLLTFFAFVQTSQAYFVAVPASQGEVRFDKTSRILLSGRGKDLGIQPQQSALTRALLYQRNFPDHQIVLLSVFEDEKNEAALKKAGWNIIVNNETNLETFSAMSELMKFTKIRSLEFFGHNSPTLGTQTDGLGFRFDTREPIVKELTARFDSSAYVIFHGCNSGWIMAQELSKIWNIAVSGAFTGTHFERLHSDGHFYVYTDAKAPNANWAKRNPEMGGIPCEEGGCIRMRPSYAPYNAKWGKFEGPILSHYKFFCQLDQRDCEKRMAASLYGFIGERSLTPISSRSEFKDIAKQYLCPLYRDRKATNDCLEQLDLIEAGRGNMNLSYVVRDKQLKCDLKGCTGKMTCDNHTCTIEGRVSKDSKTLAEEYLHFLNGYEALQKDGL